MNKKELLAKLRNVSGKSISECINAMNKTNADFEKSCLLLFENEIEMIRTRTNTTDERLISKALIISKNNIEGAISLLTHGYDCFTKEKKVFPEFLISSDNAKYDDASWHYGENFPADLPIENGAIHIGMFLNWCIDTELISGHLRQDAKQEILQVKNRAMSGTEFVMTVCDGKLTSYALNNIGNEFATEYYENDTAFGKCYADDYARTFNEKVQINGFEYISIYHVENTFENYDLIKSILDIRFNEWKKYRNKISQKCFGKI